MRRNAAWNSRSRWIYATGEPEEQLTRPALGLSIDFSLRGDRDPCGCAVAPAGAAGPRGALGRVARRVRVAARAVAAVFRAARRRRHCAPRTERGFNRPADPR